MATKSVLAAAIKKLQAANNNIRAEIRSGLRKKEDGEQRIQANKSMILDFQYRLDNNLP
jgi:hypothetical protein